MKLLYLANDENINIARTLLSLFKKTYYELYGAYHCTLTYHLITCHLVDDTIAHGSSIGHSSYALEGALGILTNSLHGTVGYSGQMIRSKIIKFFLRFIKFFLRFIKFFLIIF